MQSTKTPTLLKYSITPGDEGIVLSIWEPAPVNDVRVRPFLFMARYRLDSKDEVSVVLSQYQQAYRRSPHTQRRP